MYGLQNVLSTQTSTLCLCAIAAAAAISVIPIVGLAGVSRYKSLVFG